MSDNQNRQKFVITSTPLIDNNIPIGDPISILNGLNANDYAAVISASAKAKEQALVSILFDEILDVKAKSLYLETKKIYQKKIKNRIF